MIGIFIPTTTRLRVQYGLKFAITGALTLYCALWLRLDAPRWALATVIVLMVAQYVGAMVEKAFLRLLGTVTGALVGVFLVGNFLGNGPLFLTLIFICIAFLGYMSSGKKSPYAFLLCAYTLLIVVSATIFEPKEAWNIGLSRALSIIVGIIVTLIVSTILWPRHARIEFRQLAVNMLKRVGAGAREIERSFYSNHTSQTQTTKIDANHVKDIQLLEKLLLFGARESAAFALRVPSYQIIMDCLNRLHSVFMSITRTQHVDHPFAHGIRKTLTPLIDAIEKECSILCQSLTNATPPEIGFLDSASTAFRCRLERFEIGDFQLKDKPTEAFDLAIFATGFLDAVEQLSVIRKQLNDLFCGQYYQPQVTEEKTPWFKFNRNQAISGIKGAVTTVFALIFCNWHHPPGFEIIPSSAYLFIMLPGTYFHGNKSQKIMHNTLWTGLMGIPVLALFTFLSPWIANYPYANIFLFVTFFLLGIAYFEHVGIFSQLYFAFTLAIVGGIDLCKEWPFDVNKFEDWYFGIFLALCLCAVVQRMVWPILPQNEFFKGCQCYFAGCLRTLAILFKKPSGSPSNPVNIFQIAWNTTRWLPFLPLRACDPQEQERLDELLTEMRAAGYQLSMLEGAAWRAETIAFFAEALPLLKPLIESLRQDLNECYEAFRSRCTPFSATTNRSAPIDNFQTLYHSLQKNVLWETVNTHVMMEILGALWHLKTAADSIWKCRQLASTLQLENYATDVAL